MPIFDPTKIDLEWYEKNKTRVLTEGARLEAESMKRNRERDKREGRKDNRVRPWDDVDTDDEMEQVDKE